jgi:hypothetical protein
MSPGKTTVDAVGNDRKWYRLGGIAALILAGGYIFIFVLYAQVGAPPNGGGESWFKYLPGKTTVWWAILGLSVFTDFLFVPIALALYLALKAVNKNAMLLATAFVGLFVVLDLAVTWTHYASILSLYRGYSAAVDNAQRAGFVAAADYASAMLMSRLEIVYAIVTLSFGILLTGLVMLRGPFGKITAYLGVATGILGIVSLAGTSLTIIGNAVFATAWLLAVGYRLHRIARQ